MRRLKLFIDALGGIASQIHIAHLAPPSEIAGDHHTLETLQSQIWDRPLRLTLVASGSRQETFRTHYLNGLFHAYDQPLIHSFAGAIQAHAVGQLLDQEFDLVFIHRLSVMCAVLRSGRRPKNVFFDLDDIEHLVRLRYAMSVPRRPGKLAYAAHVPALLAAERKGIALARQTFICSSRDQAALARYASRGKVAVVPNALPLPSSDTPPASAPTLLFIGGYDYRPNIEAAERLVNHILPLIRKTVPDAKVLIAGKGSENLPSRKMAPENVEYLGYVADLDELYANTRIVCCPLLNGGGTRIKLIEGSAYGRPLVSTRIGAEGLDFHDGKHILLRDSDEDFAQACALLLRDHEACVRLGLAARARMQILYEAGNAIERIRTLVLSNLE